MVAWDTLLEETAVRNKKWSGRFAPNYSGQELRRTGVIEAHAKSKQTNARFAQHQQTETETWPQRTSKSSTSESNNRGEDDTMKPYVNEVCHPVRQKTENPNSLNRE